MEYIYIYKDGCNKDEQDETLEYREAIREMIKSENEIRNQRNNWFLVIQGFLIAGICQLSCLDVVLKFFISLVGLVTTISFWQAAWRSTLATTYALSWWEIYNKSMENIPPVSLITRNILDSKKEKNSFEKQICDKMYLEMDECTKWKANNRNELDWLLPYNFLPYVFFIFWIIYIVCLFVWKC